MAKELLPPEPNLARIVGKDFASAMARARAIITTGTCTIRLISHYDADGITAAGVMSSVFIREGLPFHLSLVKSLESDKAQELADEKNDLIVFLDMGSGQLDLIENSAKRIVIVDHHQPLRSSDLALQLNGHFFGIDGASEASASSTAFAFALAFSQTNWDLIDIGLAGAYGDREHVGGLKGMNKKLAHRAVENKSLIETNCTNLNTKVPVKNAIANSLDPMFRGLAGDPDACVEFLSEKGIDPELKIRDMDEPVQRSLYSVLLLRMMSHDVEPGLAENLTSFGYYSPRLGMEISDIASYVNACGRTRNEATGLAFCLGDTEAIKSARESRDEYRNNLRTELLALLKEGLNDEKNLQYFYAKKSEYAGAMAGMGMQYMFGQGKPVISLIVKEEKTSISARGTKKLIAEGLDLATACREAAGNLGGQGGGHSIASGASIPVGKEEKFIKHMNKIIGQQLKEGKKETA